MSSSSDVVLRNDDSLGELRTAARPDLRTGVWTRLGDPSVLGDAVTEAALGSLAEATRTAARAQGYAVGWAQGRQEALVQAEADARVAVEESLLAEERREAEHREALTALQRAAGELRGVIGAVCERIGQEATDLAFEVTRALVGHELDVVADPGADVVRRVVSALPGDAVQVRLHPSVASSATAALAEHGVRVISDPALLPSDALVETEDSVLDLRVGAALDRLREVLR